MDGRDNLGSSSTARVPTICNMSTVPVSMPESSEALTELTCCFLNERLLFWLENVLKLSFKLPLWFLCRMHGRLLQTIEAAKRDILSRVYLLFLFPSKNHYLLLLRCLYFFFISVISSSSWLPFGSCFAHRSWVNPQKLPCTWWQQGRDGSPAKCSLLLIHSPSWWLGSAHWWCRMKIYISKMLQSSVFYSLSAPSKHDLHRECWIPKALWMPQVLGTKKNGVVGGCTGRG